MNDERRTFGRGKNQGSWCVMAGMVVLLLILFVSGWAGASTITIAHSNSVQGHLFPCRT